MASFQNLRTGSTVYAFYKSNSPQFEVGQVVAEPEFKAKYPSNLANPGTTYNPASFLPRSQEQVIKLTIRFGEKIQPIEGLKPTAEIQDCGNGLFLSTSREAINAEVVAYKQLSDNAIDPAVIAAHREISECCANILLKINPEVAERQRLEAENKKLRDELRAIKTETTEVKGMLNSLLEQLGGPVKK